MPIRVAVPHETTEGERRVALIPSVAEQLSKQDIQVLLEASKERKGIICICNKWDLLNKDHRTMNDIKRDIQERLGELRYIPSIFTSIPKKQRLYKMIDLATAVYFEKQKYNFGLYLGEVLGAIIDLDLTRQVDVQYVSKTIEKAKKDGDDKIADAWTEEVLKKPYENFVWIS